MQKQEPIIIRPRHNEPVKIDINLYMTPRSIIKATIIAALTYQTMNAVAGRLIGPMEKLLDRLNGYNEQQKQADVATETE